MINLRQKLPDPPRILHAPARAHWLTVEWLPKYAPGLNDIEVVWRDLKAHNLAHQTFSGVARSR
jgi:transposase